jgi:hypothetical protein
MILNTGDIWEPEDADIIQWQKTYPAVDVFSELAKMESWLDANPSKRKTQKALRGLLTLGYRGRRTEAAVVLYRWKAKKQYGSGLTLMTLLIYPG